MSPIQSPLVDRGRMGTFRPLRGGIAKLVSDSLPSLGHPYARKRVPAVVQQVPVR